MDIDYWMIATGVLWVLGGPVMYGVLQSFNRGRLDPFDWAGVIAWPVVSLVMTASEGYQAAREAIRRKRS